MLDTDAVGRMVTVGRRRFHGIVRELGGAEVARELGITEGCVSQLARGLRRPSLDLAIVVQDRLGIPCHEWRWRNAARRRASAGPSSVAA
jgi:hypothetical protein